MTAIKKLNLALQGGGAHGAYTWGVLDRLLEERTLEIEGISGTSAGAMNAAVFATGWEKGGREGAKEALEGFWLRIAEFNPLGFFSLLPDEGPFANWNLDRYPWYAALEAMSQMISPYVANPLNYNPLRAILDETIDYDLLNNEVGVKLFIAATRVSDGQAKVFMRGAITTDVLLASSCLPFSFQAVEIGGQYFWDGGYIGNPVIWPMIYRCDSEDVLLVQINPIDRPQLPKTAAGIMNRMNEITFNSSLISEMRAIHFVSKLVDDNKLDPKKYKRMRMHMIERPDAMEYLNASSKMNTSWAFFEYLKLLGRRAADAWLATHLKDVGKRGTADIEGVFLRK